MSGKLLLLVGGLGSYAIALLHVGIAIVGPSAYTYFGAAELGRMDAQRSWVPAALTLTLAALFAVFACYAFAGVGWLRPLPVLKPVLLSVACVYILRGLIVVPDIIRLINGAGYPVRQTVFSAASLTIGLLYLLGWLQLGARHSPPGR